MSTDDRTPDTREVRSMYDAGSNLFRETPEQHYLGHPAPDYGAEFDRWLTAHDARVRRDAAREALDGLAGHTERMAQQDHRRRMYVSADRERHVAHRVIRYRDTHYPEQED